MAATPMTVNAFKRINDLKLYRFTKASILAGANTGELSFAVPKRGKIVSLCIKCPTSVNFDFHIFQKTGETYPSIESLYYMTACNIFERHVEQEVYYFNNDTVPVDKLYFYLVNQDGANPTGLISLEVGIEVGGHDV